MLSEVRSGMRVLAPYLPKTRRHKSDGGNLGDGTLPIHSRSRSDLNPHTQLRIFQRIANPRLSRQMDDIVKRLGGRIISPWRYDQRYISGNEISVAF